MFNVLRSSSNLFFLCTTIISSDPVLGSTAIGSIEPNSSMVLTIALLYFKGAITFEMVKGLGNRGRTSEI